MAAVLAAVLGLLAILARSPVRPLILRREANEAARTGRWDEAESFLARIGNPSPADWLLRAVVAHTRKDDAAALRYLDKLPKEGAIADQAALVTAQVEQNRHHARAMEASLRRAIQVDPGNVAARRLLVYLYGIQGRRSELMEQFAALAEIGPLSFDLVHHWCLSRGEIGEPAEVKADLEAFVAADPEDLASRIALADAYRKLGQLDLADSTLAPATNSNPDVRALRAQIAVDRGDTKAAAELLAEGPESHAKLARLRGRLALSRRDAAAAVKSLRASDAAEPNNHETLFVLAQAVRLSGDAAEAERISKLVTAHQALRTLLAARPDTTSTGLMKYAAACEAVGLLPEAIAWYRLAVSADPLDTKAQQALFRLSSSVAKPATSGDGAKSP